MNDKKKESLLIYEAIKNELKRKNPFPDEQKLRCVQMKNNEIIEKQLITKKVKKFFSDKSKTMKANKKKDEKIKKNAEIALKLQQKENEKEEKMIKKNAEIAFKLQQREHENEKKMIKNNAKRALNLRKTTNLTRKNNAKQELDDGLIDLEIEEHLNRIILLNKRDDEKLFMNLAKKNNVLTKQNGLKSMKQTMFAKQVNNYLTTVCSDSGECLAFGRENVEIKKMFSDFIDFRHLKSLNKTGSPSSNGFVLNLHYEVNNYKANALLKSSNNAFSDNLYYEYLVGNTFINRVNKIFPCFTETYHLFQHGSETTRQNIQKNEIGVSEHSIDLNGCDASAVKNTFACIEKSCNDGVNFAILVQYISNPISVASFIDKHGDDDLFTNQMLCILYQIYSCLSYLKDHFTHYDLHMNNVLLYKLPEGKYINIKYIDEQTGKETTIQTNYIAKIIDYGRCYFGNLGNKESVTSKTIGKLLLKSKVCSKLGFEEVGYNYFDEIANIENSYISSIQKNISHDLRLAFSVSISSKLRTIFRDKIVFEDDYGTPQKKSDRSGKLNNVSDMFHFLGKMRIDLMKCVNLTDKSVGTIQVNMTKKLCEKQMKFIPE